MHGIAICRALFHPTQFRRRLFYAASDYLEEERGFCGAGGLSLVGHGFVFQLKSPERKVIQ